MRKLVVLSVALMLVSLAHSAQVLNLTCRTVATSTCASGYQYVTAGAYENIVLNHTYCVPQNQSCVVGIRQFNIQACTIDYKNQACSTGVCFMYPQAPICTKDKTCGNTANPISYTANYTCSDCSAGSNCAKCFDVSTNEPGVNSSSTCLGQTCTGGLSTSTTSVGPCPNGFDTLGEECFCCVVTQEVSRFCTTNSGPLSQSGVTDWFMRVEGRLFQWKTQAVLGFVLLTLFMMMF